MSPKAPKQNEIIRQQSRNKILEAALELFAIRGFHNTSIEQIRKLAGVSKGLIYNYFDDKEDLMNQIVFEQIKQGDVILKEMELLNSSEEKFKYLLNFTFEYIKSQEHHSRLMLGLALQMEDFPKLKNIVLSRYKGTMPLITKLLKDLGVTNPKQEAISLAASLDGIGLQYLIVGSELDLDEIKAYFIDKYCS